MSQPVSAVLATNAPPATPGPLGAAGVLASLGPAPARSNRSGAGGEPPPLAPNPRLSLDARTGLVVIEFRSGGGRLDQSFPSDKQLDAYRRHAGGSGSGGGAGGAFGPVPPDTARGADP